MNKQAYDIGVRLALNDAGIAKLAEDEPTSPVKNLPRNLGFLGGAAGAATGGGLGALLGGGHPLRNALIGGGIGALGGGGGGYLFGKHMQKKLTPEAAPEPAPEVGLPDFGGSDGGNVSDEQLQAMYPELFSGW